MAENDFDLVNNLFCKLVDKKERKGNSSLAVEEVVVLSIWHASGIIENGGIQYFFEQELDAEAVACAYEQIGCDKCAELLRLALSLFPAHIHQAGRSERIKHVEDNKEIFEKLSSAFWKADKEMEPQLAEFIRKHLAKSCSSA